jgi:hypothetical protein
MKMSVVFSRRDAEWFSPPHAPERCYLIAPLTFRERQAFRADLARDGGIYPPQAQMLDALRLAITEAAPGNAEELAAAIARAEAEAACAAIPSYAGLLAARQRYIGMLPWVAARHALRGWEGQDLPPFKRDRSLVSEALMDALPQEDIEPIGWRASALMQPSRDAEKNSAAPSPSPASPAPMTVD